MSAIQFFPVDSPQPVMRPRIHLLSEPFRVFFPAGVAAGMLGVALWPVWVAGWLPWYPGLAHARLMTGGFFGAMIIGFLGTAGPRMLGARHLRAWEFRLLASGWVLAVVAALVNAIAIADGLACAIFALGFYCAAARFRQRQDLPPPGFSMVAMGLVSGFLGTALNLALDVAPALVPAPAQLSALGRLLSEQAFVLLPILGVAPFFFPRFGGLPNRHAAFPDSRAPTPAWASTAQQAAACGALLLATYVVEAFGHPAVACVARGVVAAVWIVREIPLRFPRSQVGTLGRVVQLGMALLVLGLVLPGLFPAQRVGLLHLLFVGGFGLVTLAVANWVIFGHGGIGRLARGRLVFVRWSASLIILAMATRASADFLPAIRMSHLLYAALAWIAGMAIWSWRVLPQVLRSDD